MDKRLIFILLMVLGSCNLLQQTTKTNTVYKAITKTDTMYLPGIITYVLDSASIKELSDKVEVLQDEKDSLGNYVAVLLSEDEIKALDINFDSIYAEGKYGSASAWVTHSKLYLEYFEGGITLEQLEDSLHRIIEKHTLEITKTDNTIETIVRQDTGFGKFCKGFFFIVVGLVILYIIIRFKQVGLKVFSYGKTS